MLIFKIYGIIRLSKNIIGTNETIFSHNVLLNGRQVLSLYKAFANSSLVNKELWKSSVSKIIQPAGFPAGLLGTLMKVVLSLMKNVLAPSTKSFLILLGLTAAASAANEEVFGKMLQSGASDSEKTTIIIWNEEKKDAIKLVKSLEDSELLIKCVIQTTENETKEKIQVFFMLLGASGASFF